MIGPILRRAERRDLLRLRVGHLWRRFRLPSSRLRMLSRVRCSRPTARFSRSSSVRRMRLGSAASASRASCSIGIRPHFRARRIPHRGAGAPRGNGRGAGQDWRPSPENSRRSQDFQVGRKRCRSQRLLFRTHRPGRPRPAPARHRIRRRADASPEPQSPTHEPSRDAWRQRDRQRPAWRSSAGPRASRHRGQDLRCLAKPGSGVRAASEPLIKCAAHEARVGGFGGAELADFVYDRACQIEIDRRCRGHVLLGNMPIRAGFGLPCGNITAFLRRIVFVGKATLGRRFDFLRMGLRARNPGGRPPWFPRRAHPYRATPGCFRRQHPLWASIRTRAQRTSLGTPTMSH